MRSAVGLLAPRRRRRLVLRFRARPVLPDLFAVPLAATFAAGALIDGGRHTQGVQVRSRE
jgi:hypothetical protein